MGRYSKSKDKEKKIALDHINAMFDEAKRQSKKNFELSNKLVKRALNLKKRLKITLPKELKKKFCKNCNNYFIHGENCRVRVQNGKIIYFCLKCKSFIRTSVTPKKEVK